MSFAQPGLAIAAIMAAAIPFVLHLILRRPQSTQWPSTMLLRRAIAKLHRRHRLERWILLAIRSLALALVGMAMAGPFARAWQGDHTTRELWVVIDHGATSAERIGDGQSQLDSLKRGISVAMSELQDGDRVAIVSAANPANILVQPTSDLDLAQREVDRIRTHAVPANIQAALELCLPAQESNSNHQREVLLASGCRRGSIHPEQPLPAAWQERGQHVQWTSLRPQQSTAPNRAIWSARVGRSASELQGTQDVPVRVELRRFDGQGAATDSVVARTTTGNQLGHFTGRWSEQSNQMEVTIPTKITEAGGIIIEATNDAQPLDDTIPVVVESTANPRVVILGRKSDSNDLEQLSTTTWITRALQATGMTPQELDPGSLALRPPTDAETIIVCRPDLLDEGGWKWLGGWVGDGGTAVVMPVVEAAEQGWMSELDRSLGVSVHTEPIAKAQPTRLAARQPRSEIFSLLGAEIDSLSEPVGVQKYISLVSEGSEVTPALVLDNGLPAMVMARPRNKNGIVIVFGIAPELSWSDLPLKPLMVPLFQEIVRAGHILAMSRGDLRSGEFGWLGHVAAGGVLTPHAAVEAGAVGIEIDSDGRTASEIPSPGLWKLRQRNGKERLIAVRLDPMAASIEPVEPAALQTWWKALGEWKWFGETEHQQRATDSPESPWSYWLLVAALGFLVAESFWSRRGSPHTNQPAAAT